MIIRRYIVGSILASVAIALLVLLSLFAVITVVDELGSVGKGGYTVVDALQYVMLRMVGIGHQLLPIAALMGAIMGLGALAGSSELTAIRAGGFSLRSIVSTVLGVGLMLMVLSALIGEYIVPRCEHEASRLRADAMSEDIALGADNHLWARDGEAYISVGEVNAPGHLSQLSIYHLNQHHQLKQVITAHEAVYVDGQWSLRHGAETLFAEGRLEHRPFEVSHWRGRLTPDILRVFNVEPEQLSLIRLYQYTYYLKENGLESFRYQQAFWKKLVAPFVTIIMVLLAIPFVFGPLRSVGIGQRILVGLLVGLGFHLSNQMSGYLGVVYRLDPMLSAIAPTLAFTVLALVLMRRVR